MSIRHPWPGLHRDLLQAGWTHRIAKGHHQYRPPADRPDAPAVITLPHSPSDWRAMKNAQRTIRRWTQPTAKEPTE